MEDGESREVQISKELAVVLRHKPPPGSMDGCGFVPVSKLAQHPNISTTDGNEIIHVAENDDKGRYQLDDSNENDLRVRATQGHSIKLENPLLDPIQGPHEVPLALHATSEEAWQEIQKTGFLKRMNRTHIHFASDPHHLRANDWACVLLKVDLHKAIKRAQCLYDSWSVSNLMICRNTGANIFQTEIVYLQNEKMPYTKKNRKESTISHSFLSSR